jgi:hypothetical protein
MHKVKVVYFFENHLTRLIHISQLAGCTTVFFRKIGVLVINATSGANEVNVFSRKSKTKKFKLF